MGHLNIGHLNMGHLNMGQFNHVLLFPSIVFCTTISLLIRAEHANYM